LKFAASFSVGNNIEHIIFLNLRYHYKAAENITRRFNHQ